MRALERKRQAATTDSVTSRIPDVGRAVSDPKQRSVYALQGSLDWQRERARRKKWQHEWEKDSKLKVNSERFAHVDAPLKQFIGKSEERFMVMVASLIQRI